jgi:hypothetical protein
VGITPQQIVGDGVPITLLDGSTVAIKISNRSMVKIDELCGSFEAARQQLARGTEGPLFSTTTKVIWAGLQHLEEWRNDLNRVLDSLDPVKAVDEYQLAITEAMQLAFPQLTQGRKPSLEEMMAQTFPGSPSTESADAISTSAMTSSGT